MENVWEQALQDFDWGHARVENGRSVESRTTSASAKQSKSSSSKRNTKFNAMKKNDLIRDDKRTPNKTSDKSISRRNQHKPSAVLASRLDGLCLDNLPEPRVEASKTNRRKRGELDSSAHVPTTNSGEIPSSAAIRRIRSVADITLQSPANLARLEEVIMSRDNSNSIESKVFHNARPNRSNRDRSSSKEKPMKKVKGYKAKTDAKHDSSQHSRSPTTSSAKVAMQDYDGNRKDQRRRQQAMPKRRD